MCCAVPKINQLRLYWANKTVNYSVLILLTLLGVVIPAWYYQLNTWITPLILRVIAAALADRDDRFSGRLKSIILTLICFAIAAFSIEILFQTPWLFALGLFTSSFGFIMLGAMGHATPASRLLLYWLPCTPCSVPIKARISGFSRYFYSAAALGTT